MLRRREVRAEPTCRRSFLKSATAMLLPLGSEAYSQGGKQKTSHVVPQPWALNIGLRKQLFVDDFAISELRDVSRVLGQAIKANKGQPIFPEGWFAGTVLRDEGTFKMWYTPRDQDFSKEEQLKGAYAESTDGLNWTKKADIAGPVGAHLAVFIDPHEKDPKHRYKTAYHPTKPPYAACLAYSADGINWTAYNNGEPVTERAADTWNQILWDEDAQVYRLMTRTDFGEWGGPNEIRGTRMMVTPDVKANPTNWTTVRSWRFDREGHEEYRRRQVYAMTDWIYESVHFGLLSVYEWVGDLSEGPHDVQRRHERGIMNFYIATSRDADQWDLHWVYAGKPIIPRGPDGTFDKDCVYPPHLILTYQDKHWVYYGGGRERHDIAHARDDYAIGLATLRLDGFMCLQAKNQLGTVVTKPFKLEGNQLEVNADARQGELTVEVLDALQSGTPITGFTKAEATALPAVDGLRLRPRWKNQADLSSLTGRIVRLKLHLQNASLYAFQVSP